MTQQDALQGKVAQCELHRRVSLEQHSLLQTVPVEASHGAAFLAVGSLLLGDAGQYAHFARTQLQCLRLLPTFLVPEAEVFPQHSLHQFLRGDVPIHLVGVGQEDHRHVGCIDLRFCQEGRIDHRIEDGSRVGKQRSCHLSRHLFLEACIVEGHAHGVLLMQCQFACHLRRSHSFLQAVCALQPSFLQSFVILGRLQRPSDLAGSQQFRIAHAVARDVEPVRPARHGLHTQCIPAVGPHTRTHSHQQSYRDYYSFHTNDLFRPFRFFRAFSELPHRSEISPQRYAFLSKYPTKTPKFFKNHQNFENFCRKIWRLSFFSISLHPLNRQTRRFCTIRYNPVSSDWRDG